MKWPKPSGKVERAGLVIALLALILMLIVAIKAMPRLDMPPHSREWLQAEAEAHHQASDAAFRRALAQALGAENSPELQEKDDRTEAQIAADQFVEENGLIPMPPDTAARWTLEKYAAASFNSLRSEWNQHGLLFFASVCLLVGLFLWLAYRYTLAPIFQYVIRD